MSLTRLRNSFTNTTASCTVLNIFQLAARNGMRIGNLSVRKLPPEGGSHVSHGVQFRPSRGSHVALGVRLRPSRGSHVALGVRLRPSRGSHVSPGCGFRLQAE